MPPPFLTSLLRAIFGPRDEPSSREAPRQAAPSPSTSPLPPFRVPLSPPLPAAPQPNAARLIVGIGDSITIGAGTSDAPATSYIGQAAAALGAPFVVLGLLGALTERITYEVASIPDDATTVVLYAGSNDVGVAAIDTTVDEAVEKVRASLPHADALFAAIRARVPAQRLIVVTVRDLGRGRAMYPNTTPDALTAGARVWNERVRELTAQAGATLLDLETDPQWYIRSEYDPSGVHPNDAGSARLAHAVVARIER